MTRCKRGDVVLVGFEFSDASGIKRRPALVISGDAYQRGRQEVIVAAITSNVSRLFGDHPIKGWREAGLLYPSVVTGIVRTVKAGMVERRLGTLPPEDLERSSRQLRESLGL